MNFWEKKIRIENNLTTVSCTKHESNFVLVRVDDLIIDLNVSASEIKVKSNQQIPKQFWPSKDVVRTLISWSVKSGRSILVKTILKNDGYIEVIFNLNTEYEMSRYKITDIYFAFICYNNLFD
jgi:hypothetical protein